MKRGITQEQGLALARAIAATGEYRNWRSVETKLKQLGHPTADLWFADNAVRDEIDALCGQRLVRR